MSGSPVGPACHAAPQKSSRPGLTGAWAKQSESACWSVPRTFTAYRPSAPDHRRDEPASVERDHHQRRLERDRRERVHGDPGGLLAVERRHDADAGREMAHDLAESVRHGLHRGEVYEVGGVPPSDRARRASPALAIPPRPSRRTRSVEAPAGGQPVRPPAILRGQPLDQPAPLEPRKRRVQGARPERLAGQRPRLGHDRVAVLRPAAQGEQDGERRLREPAERSQVLRHRVRESYATSGPPDALAPAELHRERRRDAGPCGREQRPAEGRWRHPGERRARQQRAEQDPRAARRARCRAPRCRPSRPSRRSR